jgi:alkanesulfonate monooxygenase SsuD/methylene tetrahydromethanopterin reductase-like flavin-dependent oxidoreductase (luciferase family)
VRFEEILRAMLAAWRGEVVGESSRGLELTPRPRQQPHPPLWVAAFGPKAIAQVGTLGLPYLASPMETCAELERNHQLHRDALHAAGQAVPEEVVVMRTIFISEDEQACDAVRGKLADQAATLPLRNSPVSVDEVCLVGHPEKVGNDLGHYQKALGMTHLIAVRPRVKGISEEAIRASMQALQALRLSHRNTSN